MREEIVMPACTFFGHRDAPQSIGSVLRAVLTDLIEKNNVTDFYVGNHGEFDLLVYATLQNLKQQHPYIRVTVVLAYMPTSATHVYWDDSVFPEGMETVPKRFSIDHRNKWMLRHSRYVVTYITHSWGGAAKYAALATKQGKAIINTAEINPAR